MLVKLLLVAGILFEGVYSFGLGPASASTATSKKTLRQDSKDEVYISSDSFVSPNFRDDEKTNFILLGGSTQFLDTPERYADHSFFYDVSGVLSSSRSLLNSVNVAQMYWAWNLESNSSDGVHLDPNIPSGKLSVQSVMSRDKSQPEANELKLYIGRKKEDWSSLDERWGMGLFQPVYRWNPLDPSLQGLTGLFLKKKWNPQLETEIFYSDLFLPDQGPSFEIENGQFVEGNPWFRRPPQKVALYGSETDIHYNLIKPDVKDVALNKESIAFRIKGQIQRATVQMSLSRKPIFQLPIAYRGFFNIAKGNVVDADILPKVYFHTLYGGDASYQGEIMDIGMSVVHEIPDADRNHFDSGWTYPKYENTTMYSPYVRIRPTKKLGLLLQTLWMNGGGVTEVGPDADPNRDPLVTRYRFRQANQIILETKSLGSPRLSTQLSYTESPFYKFKLLSFEAHYLASVNTRFFAELDLIDSETNLSKNDISNYRDNDRGVVGGSYVF